MPHQLQLRRYMTRRRCSDAENGIIKAADKATTNSSRPPISTRSSFPKSTHHLISTLSPTFSDMSFPIATQLRRLPPSHSPSPSSPSLNRLDPSRIFLPFVVPLLICPASFLPQRTLLSTSPSPGLPPFANSSSPVAPSQPARGPSISPRPSI